LIEVELTVEELEEVVAPSPIIPPASPLRNHNETLVGDEVGLTVVNLGRGRQCRDGPGRHTNPPQDGVGGDVQDSRDVADAGTASASVARSARAPRAGSRGSCTG